MENEKNYYSELYKRCVKIIDNKEKYVDTPIDQLLRKMPDGPYEVFFGDPADTNVHALALHNELKNLYEILVGKGKMKKDEYLPEYFDLRPKSSIATLSDEELIEAIYILSWANFTSDLHVEQDRNIKPRSQIKTHLYKIDVERSDVFLSYLIHRMYLDSKKNTQKAMHDESYQGLCARLDKYYEESRRILLKTKPDYNVCDFYRKQLIDGDKWESLKKIERSCPQFSCAKKYYDTWLYVDLCCHHILQYITNSIGNPLIDCDKFICCLNKKVIRLIESEKSYLKKVENEEMSEDAHLKASEYLFRLFSFYKFRDRLWGHIKAIKMIEKLCEKLENPDEEYYLLELADSPKPYTFKEIREMFVENENVDRVTFNTHFEEVKKSIFRYNQISGRHIAYDAVSAKAIYREVYLDTKTYGRKQCKTMYRKLLQTGTLDRSEYYFINEKINRGIYREYGYIEEYYMKNEFQENLYYLVGLILTSIEPKVIGKKMTKLVSGIEKTMDSFLEKKIFPITDPIDGNEE